MAKKRKIKEKEEKQKKTEEEKKVGLLTKLKSLFKR